MEGGIQAADNMLVRVDPRKRNVPARLSFGSTLAPASRAPEGTLWIPDKEDGVWRFAS